MILKLYNVTNLDFTNFNEIILYRIMKVKKIKKKKRFYGVGTGGT